MRKISLFVFVLVFAGCATGINHNVAVLDGKTYLIETQNFVSPILPVYQWSEPSTFTEITAPAEAPKTSVQPLVIDDRTKEIWLEIIRSCTKQYPRKSIDRQKCIEREINAL